MPNSLFTPKAPHALPGTARPSVGPPSPFTSPPAFAGQPGSSALRDAAQPRTRTGPPPVYRPAPLGVTQAKPGPFPPAPVVYRPVELAVSRQSGRPTAGPLSPASLAWPTQAVTVQCVKNTSKPDNVRANRRSTRKNDQSEEPPDDSVTQPWDGPTKRIFKPNANTKRQVRASTARKTVETASRALAGSAPVERLRRSTAAYRNITLHKRYGVPLHPELNAAIRDKKIWSGYRQDVSWSTGFPERFWSMQADKGQWVCAHAFNGICQQPTLGVHHATLEIGHKVGFYNQIVNSVDPVIVCDGTTHWQAMLFAAVRNANENYDNLSPQCQTCNRSARQRSQDDRGGGKYKPEFIALCPGHSCNATKLAYL